MAEPEVQHEVTCYVCSTVIGYAAKEITEPVMCESCIGDETEEEPEPLVEERDEKEEE